VSEDGRARLAILISGNGSNLQAILDACSDARLPARVVLVLSNVRSAFGLVRAERAGVPTRYHPLKPYRIAGRSRADYDVDLAEIVAESQPDWIVLAGWLHTLSQAFLEHFPGRVLNLHPALPGEYPGLHAIERAWERAQRGETDHAGVMVHLVPDEGIDVGPVLASETVAIAPGESLADLEPRVHAVEHRLLVKALAGVLSEEKCQ
jgi:phosphoribosylglycinamide formyltransferase 1